MEALIRRILVGAEADIDMGASGAEKRDPKVRTQERNNLLTD